MPRLARASVLAGFLLVACGEALLADDDSPIDIPVDGDAGAGDARDDANADDGASDASADGDGAKGGPCSTDLPFGPVEPLTEIAPLGDVTSVRLDRDGGALAFVSADSGPPSFFDIVEVSFPMMVSDVPTKLVSTNDPESTPAALAGGMKVYFDQPGADAGTRRIASGTRSQAGQNLSGITVEALPFSPVGTSVMQPWAVAGTDVLYYVTRPGTAGTSDIYRAEKNGGTWEAAAQRMAPFDETHPVVTDDDGVMYYARSETGKRKIFVASRPAPGLLFTGDLPVDAANDPNANDEPSWISPDQCTLIFTSDRSGAPRAYRIVRQR